MSNTNSTIIPNNQPISAISTIGLSGAYSFAAVQTTPTSSIRANVVLPLNDYEYDSSLTTTKRGSIKKSIMKVR